MTVAATIALLALAFLLLAFTADRALIVLDRWRLMRRQERERREEEEREEREPLTLADLRGLARKARHGPRSPHLVPADDAEEVVR